MKSKLPFSNVLYKVNEWEDFFVHFRQSIKLLSRYSKIAYKSYARVVSQIARHATNPFKEALQISQFSENELEMDYNFCLVHNHYP